MGSLWQDTMPAAERATGQPLPGDVQVDVAIVGAGFTGLWTAVHLLARDATLRVAVIDRDTIGFGASGRNGGWCSALLPMDLPAIAHRHGRPSAIRMQQAMHANIVEISEFAANAALGDACHRGGTVSLARNSPQRDRLRARIETLAGFGFGDDYRWLDADEARSHCNASDVVGGVFTPHCATVHPLRLTHAVARAAIAAGAAVYEHTSVSAIEPGRVTTDRGNVSADVVVMATEGYSTQFAGHRRAILPIYSLMVATEPIDDAAWRQIGLDDRPTFHDARNLIIYGQRTADGRIAFGGRGAPYHFGSRVDPSFDTDERVRGLLAASLRGLFPVLDDVAITHHWGGVLAAPRDWSCFARFDRRSGLAVAGGYVGDGVSTTHLAGRTLAALITQSDDEGDRNLIELPWVGHTSRRWEPEPLRWIGVNAARAAAGRADESERRNDRPSRVWGRVVEAVLGH